jgi:hypothetical protein
VNDAGDDLLRHIHSFVRGRVPPAMENVVTELVGRTVVLIMSRPEFYNHLRMVQELQQENWNLRQALIAYQRAEQVRAQKARTRKASAAANAKKAARPAPKKAAASNVRAFKRGASNR